MQLTIKDKTLNIWSKKRILYTICFFMFCVIDQRTKTAGWNHRDVSGYGRSAHGRYYYVTL